LRKHVPVNQIGYPLAGIVDNPAVAAKLNKPLSNEVIASMANEVVRHMQESDALTYDPTDPITAEDVAAALVRTPQVRPTLADLVRPISPPGQDVQLGSTTNNVVTNNAAVNPDYSTETGTTTENPTWTKEASTEAEQNSAVSGVMAPLQWLLDNFPKPQLTSRNVVCPALQIDMRGENMSAIGLDFAVSTDFHCQLAEDIRVPVQSFMLMFASLVAWRRFMSAWGWARTAASLRGCVAATGPKIGDDRCCIGLFELS